MVVREILLHRVISQVDLRLEAMDVEFIWRCADVPLFIPVGSSDPENVCDQNVVADVEFSVVVEEWSVDVHLDDECALLRILVFGVTVDWYVGWGWWCLELFLLIVVWLTRGLFHYGVKLVNLVDDRDSSTLIGVLSRFNDPYISCLFLGL